MDRENSPALDGRQLSARRWSVRSQLGKYCRRSKPTTQTSKQVTLDVFYGGSQCSRFDQFELKPTAFDLTNLSGSTHWILADPKDASKAFDRISQIVSDNTSVGANRNNLAIR